MTELDTINMGYERDDTVISKDEIDKIMFGVVIPSGGIYQTSNKVEVIESCIMLTQIYAMFQQELRTVKGYFKLYPIEGNTYDETNNRYNLWFKPSNTHQNKGAAYMSDLKINEKQLRTVKSMVFGSEYVIKDSRYDNFRKITEELLRAIDVFYMEDLMKNNDKSVLLRDRIKDIVKERRFALVKDEPIKLIWDRYKEGSFYLYHNNFIEAEMGDDYIIPVKKESITTTYDTKTKLYYHYYVDSTGLVPVGFHDIVNIILMNSAVYDVRI